MPVVRVRSYAPLLFLKCPAFSAFSIKNICLYQPNAHKQNVVGLGRKATRIESPVRLFGSETQVK